MSLTSVTLGGATVWRVLVAPLLFKEQIRLYFGASPAQPRLGFFKLPVLKDLRPSRFVKFLTLRLQPNWHHIHVRIRGPLGV